MASCSVKGFQWSMVTSKGLNAALLLCFILSVQIPGLSLALGLVVHGLSMSGHGKAEDLHPRLLAAWLKILVAEVPQLHLSYQSLLH